MDVILAVDMDHTWVGDLRIFLYYDLACGWVDPVLGEVLCRPGLAGCLPLDCCGCSGDMDGWYWFDDAAVVSFEDGCPSIFAPGCYGPDYDSVGLDVFDGMPSGGCFWIFVADGACGDEGELFEWEVHVLTESAPPPQEGALDIKPTSCPNPLNVKSRGVLPVAILGTEVFDVMEVNPSTIALACLAEPVRYSYEDVATPVDPDAELCECTEEGPDGYMDLSLKFATQDVVAAIAPFDDGDYISVVVTATLYDGTVVTFEDCVWIIDKTRDGLRTALDAPDTGPAASKDNTEPGTWATIKALYR